VRTRRRGILRWRTLVPFAIYRIGTYAVLLWLLGRGSLAG
jgi:hypothetical protein